MSENKKKFVPADEMENPGFKRVTATENIVKDTTPRNWEIIRDECQSGGAMDDRCDVIAASLNGGGLNVIAKRLGCGCLAVREDALEGFLTSED